MNLTCAWRTCERILPPRRWKFCSDACKLKFHVSKRRRDIKAKAVAYLGGKCRCCGYNKSLAALQFHHIGDKEFGIAYRGYSRSWERVKKELQQCELICANCHAEGHCKD